MKHGRCFVILAICALASLGSSPRGAPPVDVASLRATLESLGEDFKSSETDHFIIVSDGEASWVRSTALLLEATNDCFNRFMGRLGLPIVQPREKLQCVLIRDHARFEAFAMGQDGVAAGWMGGYYATHTNRVVFYDAETSPEFLRARRRLEEFALEEKRGRDRARDARREGRKESEEAYRMLASHAREARERQHRVLADRAAQAGAAKTTHEAAHLLAFNRGLQLRSRQYPFWLSEGLATCFEAESVEAARKGRFGPDHPNPVREKEFGEALSEGELIPLEALVEMAAPAADENVARIMYAQAHSFFRWVYRYERAALAGLFSDIAREPAGGAGGIGPRRHGELFRARFGDPARLERRWLREAGEQALRLAATPGEP